MIRASLSIAMALGLIAGTACLTAGCESMVPTHYEPVLEFQVRGAPGDKPLDTLAGIPWENLGIRSTSGVQSDVYTIHDLDYVFLDRFRLVAVSGGDLSWLGRVRFLLEAPNMPTIVLAYAEGFGRGETSRDFETTDDELWAYLADRNHRIRAELEDSVRPPRDMKLRIEARVNMRVNVHALTARHPHPMAPF